jgi:hypothetical protein
MGGVEESHGVAVEREVEGGRETTVARADDSDVHFDTVAPRARGSGGGWIRGLREVRALTQSTVAELLGMDQSEVSRLEFLPVAGPASVRR